MVAPKPKHHKRPSESAILVIGLGNPLLGDDSVGLEVIRLLRPQLVDDPSVSIDEDYWGGLRLMERMVGYDRAIVVDAICSRREPGTIHRLSPLDLPTQRSSSGHDANLLTALELGRQCGASLPEIENIVLIGIEAESVYDFTEEFTPAVAVAAGQAAQMVLEQLQRWRQRT